MFLINSLRDSQGTWVPTNNLCTRHTRAGCYYAGGGSTSLYLLRKTGNGTMERFRVDARPEGRQSLYLSGHLPDHPISACWGSGGD